MIRKADRARRAPPGRHPLGQGAVAHPLSPSASRRPLAVNSNYTSRVQRPSTASRSSSQRNSKCQRRGSVFCIVTGIFLQFAQFRQNHTINTFFRLSQDFYPYDLPAGLRTVLHAFRNQYTNLSEKNHFITILLLLYSIPLLYLCDF